MALQQAEWRCLWNRFAFTTGSESQDRQGFWTSEDILGFHQREHAPTRHTSSAAARGKNENSNAEQYSLLVETVLVMQYMPDSRHSWRRHFVYKPPSVSRSIRDRRAHGPQPQVCVKRSPDATRFLGQARSKGYNARAVVLKSTAERLRKREGYLRANLAQRIPMRVRERVCRCFAC